MYGYIILFLLFIMALVFIYSVLKAKILIRKLKCEEQSKILKNELKKNKQIKTINIILIVIAVLSVLIFVFEAIIVSGTFMYGFFTMFGIMQYEAGGDISSYANTMNFANKSLNLMALFPIFIMLVICLITLKETLINIKLCKLLENNNQTIE